MKIAGQRFWPATLAIASVAGLGVALFHYLAQMTGVTGSAGALLVVGSSTFLTLVGSVLFSGKYGRFGTLLRLLALLGTLGTIAAAWLLHEFWLVAAMVVALLAIVMDFAVAQGASER